MPVSGHFQRLFFAIGREHTGEWPISCSEQACFTPVFAIAAIPHIDLNHFGSHDSPLGCQSASGGKLPLQWMVLNFLANSQARQTEFLGGCKMQGQPERENLFTPESHLSEFERFEVDGLGRQARRKPQRYQQVSRGFTTTHAEQRRGFQPFKFTQTGYQTPRK